MTDDVQIEGFGIGPSQPVKFNMTKQFKYAMIEEVAGTWLVTYMIQYFGVYKDSVAKEGFSYFSNWESAVDSIKVWIES